MLFFRKNRRQFGYRSHRRVFVAMFLLMFISSAAISIILNASAEQEPVRSIIFTSQHSDFENNDGGAWTITKSAEWTANNKARISFEVESKKKEKSNTKYDVLLVIDNSDSMEGDKMAQVKADTTDLVNYLLSDEDNRVAQVEFNTTAVTISNFTTDKDQLVELIDTIPTYGTTNYYRGLLEAEKILNSYTRQDGRELIMLFLTDGFPNEETPNEIAQYKALKIMYPYMIINGIQYEMGDKIFQPIIDVSDFQYIASMDTLHNVLFDAIKTPYVYDDFAITDYINDYYWDLDSIESVEQSLGQASIEYEGETPKVIWDMSGVYRSGQKATMTIDVTLKNDYNNPDNLLLPTNKRTIISTFMETVDNESIDSTDTPKLKEKYDVIYDGNAPTGCDIVGIIPETESHSIYSVVEISDNQLSCAGYTFRGWKAATHGIWKINDDYFRMPEEDVMLVAVWSRPNISKSMEGTVHTFPTATLDVGETVNTKIREMSGEDLDAWYWEDDDIYVTNTLITTIEQASTLPDWFDTLDEAHIISAPDSPLPIYAWYDNGTIYYQTEAEMIYMNSNSQGLLQELNVLTSADVNNWNASRVTNMNSILLGARALTDLSIVSNWDTNNVTNMRSAFAEMTVLTDVSGIANWNVTNVTDMNGMFMNAFELESIEALSGWRPNSVTSMNCMFYGNRKLKNMNGVELWGTPNLEDMEQMFYQAYALEDVNGMANWNTSKVKVMAHMFSGAESLSDISALANWSTDSLEEVWNMFNGTAITSADALANWDMTRVNSFEDMFRYATQLEDISALATWETPNLEYLYGTFEETIISDITPLLNWDFSKVKSMSSMFRDVETLEDASSMKDWNVSSALTDISEMLYYTSIDDISFFDSWDFPQKYRAINGLLCGTNVSDISPLQRFDLTNVTNLKAMFCGTQITDLTPIKDWDVSKVTSMESIFSRTIITDYSPIKDWDVSKVKTLSFAFTSSAIADMDDFSNWQLNSLTSLYHTFYGTKNLVNIDGISGWNVSKVTNMYGTFSFNTALTNLNALSGWDVQKVTNMGSMFNGTTGLTDISGISNWQTLSLTNISTMFQNDKNITDLSALENWYHTRITSKTDTFKNIPTSVARPTWY